jgi:hypothetical protein
MEALPGARSRCVRRRLEEIERAKQNLTKGKKPLMGG